MIGEIATIINSTSELRQPDTIKALYQHKKLVAETVAESTRQSVKESFKQSKARSLGKTALAGFNTAWLYLEDIPWAAGTVALMKSSPNSAGKAVAVGVAAAAVSGPNIALTRFSMRHMSSDESFKTETPENGTGKFSRIAKHGRNFLKTIGKGPVFNSVQSNFSKKEAIMHNLSYGVVGSALIGLAHEVSSVASFMQPLDKPIVFGAIAGGLVATDYVKEVCNRAAGIEAEESIDYSVASNGYIRNLYTSIDTPRLYSIEEP
jgi:hypothetical protein